MASVIINDLPDELHHALEQRARQHHRSLNKEVIALIEAGLSQQEPIDSTQADKARQQRVARVMALRGKYRNSLSSSDEFARRKGEEIERER